MPEAAFRVTGRVQGVGFRWWTRGQALRLGIDGSVRNAADGSVEVIASGDEQALAELRRLLSVGPPGADVTGVEPLGLETSATPGFHIAR
jgi:acylphosphatase